MLCYNQTALVEGVRNCKEAEMIGIYGSLIAFAAGRSIYRKYILVIGQLVPTAAPMAWATVFNSLTGGGCTTRVELRGKICLLGKYSMIIAP
ncbi:hypothetical protein BGX38DRAFT_212362 [Terfezia claveryi]|nr:hypothetical protein BGX38DRAFT_212362 [Terfezia claveryi]